MQIIAEQRIENGLLSVTLKILNPTNCFIQRNPAISYKVTKIKRNDQLQLENIPIRMRVTFNSKRIDFYTGYRTDADKWDAENQRATGMNQTMQTASEINDYLDFLKAEIIKVFHKYEFMEQMPTREQVKADFNERISQKSDENGYVAMRTGHLRHSNQS